MGMKYACKINNGSGDNAHSRETGYYDATIKLLDSNRIELTYYDKRTEILDFISIKNNFLNVTLVFFSLYQFCF